MEITDDVARHRYLALIDGAEAGVLIYRDRGADRRVLVHTEVDPAYEGRGVGGALARFALEDLRGRGWGAVAMCPFVQGWLQRHPEQADVVVA